MFRNKERMERVFGRGKRQDEARMRELRGEIAVLTDRLSQLRHTRIRVSVPTENGIRPIWDVDVESAIMLTNMTRGDMGPKHEGMHIEVISQYSPLMIPDEGDAEYADDIRPGD